MALPEGVTVNNSTPVTQVPPTTIQSTPTGTIALLTTYLAPLLTGLNISVPTGYSVQGFNFRINPDGSSTARVMWAPTPTS